MSKLNLLEMPKKLADILWGLVLMTIPVTSFRHFPEIFRGTIVQPLAIVPLALLGIVLVYLIIRSKNLQNILKLKHLSNQHITFGTFAIV